MSYEDRQPRKTAASLQSNPIITIHCAHGSWVKDGVVKGWDVIIEDAGRLEKVKSYDKSLTEHGEYPVEYYRNSRYERCIRRPNGR